MDIIPPSSKEQPKENEVSEQKEDFKITESPKPKKKKRGLIMFFSFLLIGVLVIGGYFLFKKEIQKPLNFSDKKERTIEVVSGDGTKEIGKKLKEASIIKNDIYFILYVFIRGSSLQAGKYAFSASMSIPEIVQKMVLGETVPEGVKVTIPEGFRISQIEEKINKELKTTEDNKIKISEFKVSDFKEKFSFLNDAPTDASLEGYLFPDTYFFPDDEEMTKEEKAKVIVGKMLDNFQEKLDSELTEEVKNQNKTIFQIITMASIIEKEVKTKEDREIVSGIFWERIKIGQALESCATIAYILGKDKSRYSFEDTRIESPYNTYLNRGLPKGPISNPGLEAIEAAIYSQETDYNYFLTDPKTGNTIFAKTLDEHNQNKVEYLGQ